MKTCSLNSFIDDLKPWLSGGYISKAVIESKGLFTLYLVNGTMNIYKIDDCTRNQVEQVCEELSQKGIFVERK